MARVTKSLTTTQIDKAKPKEKEYPLADGGSLFLRVKPNGAKVWLFNYSRPLTKKRNNLSLGNYPDVSLAQARELRAEYRALLAQDIDPMEHRKNSKKAKLDELNSTYGAVAWAWLEYRQTKKHFSESYKKDVVSLIKRGLLPHFANIPITQITAPMALKAFK